MEEQLQLFTVLETSSELDQPMVNAAYDDEVRARRRFKEIFQRKFNEISSTVAPSAEPTAAVATGVTTVQYRMEEIQCTCPQLLLSQKIFCDETTVIPAGYFVGEQILKNSKLVLTMSLTAGCNRVHLARHETVKRDWLQTEEDLVYKVQSLHAQLNWMQERIAEEVQQKSDYLKEVLRLEREVDSLDSAVAKLNLSNSKLTYDNSQLQAENLQLYRSLQSPQASGAFYPSPPSGLQSVSPNSPLSKPRSVNRATQDHPTMNPQFMSELKERILSRPQ